MATDERNENRKRLQLALGEQAYHLELFGDYLAKKNKYKVHDGFDAVHFYLVQKHHWKLSDVRAMTADDLRFVLEEEMAGWTVGKKA